MSRVADALRKDRGVGPRRTAEGDAHFAEGDSWPESGNPWSPVEAPTPPGETGPSTVPASHEAGKAAGVVSDHGRPLPGIGSHSREQLVPIVQYLLQEGSGSTRLRSLLFTPVGPEHSGSVCAATAAALAAQTPASICIVDANLRAPSLAATFGVDGVPGLSDLLLEGGHFQAYVARLSSNLWLMPAGRRCAEAQAFFGAEQMRRHVRELLAAFDYVLLDSPAASAHTDAVAVGALLDGVVLVLAANATRREVARRTVDQLNTASVKIVGAILTNRDFPIPERLYRLL